MEKERNEVQATVIILLKIRWFMDNRSRVKHPPTDTLQANDTRAIAHSKLHIPRGRDVSTAGD